MKLITTVSEMKETSKILCKQDKKIGFVPTMGFLHEGHLTLIREARKECDIVIISVFVNPLQFGVNEDYDSYPRDVERDQELAKSAGADYFFAPTVSEMYPKEMLTTMQVTKLSDVLCGAKRVGHFDGVATVVMKLLHIVSPDNMYMGIKDAQQVAVLQRMIEDFNVDTKVIPIEIVREESGLAMSSRNKYLTEQELQEAPILYKVLKQARQSIEDGVRSREDILRFIKEELLPLHAEIDYIEILSYPDLEILDTLQGQIIIALAVKFPNARLIDNVIVQIEE